MTKPPNFFDLPGILQESLLWDMDLDYDSYESSKAETIHLIGCANNYISTSNQRIIDSAYRFMDEAFLIERSKALLENEEKRVEILRNFIK